MIALIAIIAVLSCAAFCCLCAIWRELYLFRTQREFVFPLRRKPERPRHL